MDAGELRTRIEHAASAVPELVNNFIKGTRDPEARHTASTQMHTLLGETYADVLALLIALAEYAAEQAGLAPNPDPDNPEFGYAIRIYSHDGTPLTPEQNAPEHVWSTRLMAAVWGGDVPQVDALFHVFTDSMDTTAQIAAMRSVLSACGQIVHAAQHQKEGGQ